MSALVIDYEELVSISSYSNDLAKHADKYADSLNQKVYRGINSTTGGVNNLLQSAQYYINTKIQALQEKSNEYTQFATRVDNLATNAKRIDIEVAKEIATSQENFFKSNPHLEIDEWKASIINWLVDFKNSNVIFEMIGDGLACIGTAVSGTLDNIKYWYKCEGGKETVKLCTAILGAIAAVAVFVATIPVSGFIAACAAISSAITAMNATYNIYSSAQAVSKKKSGDPAWSKIYSDENKWSDCFRRCNSQSAIGNQVLNGLAAALDLTELVCGTVGLGGTLKDFSFKSSFLENFFSKNAGLRAYMKTAKWKTVDITDDLGNVIGTTRRMVTDRNNVVETTYTFKSILRGIKAYTMNSPIDAHSEEGIRTILNGNFKADFKASIESTFNLTALKDTFRYNATGGGRISFSEWRQSFSMSSVKDTIRYNISNSSLMGIFDRNTSWAEKTGYIKKTAKSFQNVADNSEKIASMFGGEYSVVEDIQSTLVDNIKEYSSTTEVISGIDDLVTKSKELYANVF